MMSCSYGGSKHNIIPQPLETNRRESNPTMACYSTGITLVDWNVANENFIRYCQTGNHPLVQEMRRGTCLAGTGGLASVALYIGTLYWIQYAFHRLTRRMEVNGASDGIFIDLSFTQS
jgi:hypothetical protein